MDCVHVSQFEIRQSPAEMGIAKIHPPRPGCPLQPLHEETLHDRGQKECEGQTAQRHEQQDGPLEAQNRVSPRDLGTSRGMVRDFKIAARSRSSAYISTLRTR